MVRGQGGRFVDIGSGILTCCVSREDIDEIRYALLDPEDLRTSFVEPWFVMDIQVRFLYLVVL